MPRQTRQERRAATAEYRTAKRELRRVNDREEAAGVHEETDDYLRANHRVDRAANALPWWRR